MKTKKLLSIILAVTLLISVIIPTGIFTASAAQVSEYITAGNYFKFTYWYTGSDASDSSVTRQFKSINTGDVIECQFDYYLATDTTVYPRLGQDPWTSCVDKTTNSPYLMQGRHSFDGSFTSPVTTSGQWNFQIQVGPKSVVYIWNVRILKNGTELMNSATTSGGVFIYGDTRVSFETDSLSNLSYDETTTMEKLDFGDDLKTKSDYKLFEGLTVGAQYALSVDYFLDPGSNPLETQFQFMDITGYYPLQKDLKPGRHTLSYIITIESGKNKSAPGFKINNLADTSGYTLYVWNFRFAKLGDNNTHDKNLATKAWNDTTFVTAETYDESKFVLPSDKTAIHFTYAEQCNPYKVKSLAPGDYTVSFNYYLADKNPNCYFKLFDVTGSNTVPTVYLYNGSGSISQDFTVTESKQVAPGFNRNGTGTTNFYLYDFKVVKKGTTEDLFANTVWTYNEAKVTKEDVKFDADMFGMTQKIEHDGIATETLATIPVPYSISGANVTFKYFLDAPVVAKVYAGNEEIGEFTEGKDSLTIENADIPFTGLTVKVSGDKGTLYIREFEICDDLGIVANNSISSVENATGYDLVGNSSVVSKVLPEITSECQDNAIVFEASVNATGITMDQDDKRGDLTGCTVNFGESVLNYKLVDFGMVVARSAVVDAVPESELVIGTSNPLVRTVSAENLTAVTDSNATFTVTVDNIMSGYETEYVAVRSYAVLKSDTAEPTVIYGDYLAVAPSAKENMVFPFGNQSTKFEVEATSKRNEILSTSDEITAVGNVYYVSYKGNDQTGDGSLSNPFRTAAKIKDTTIPTTGGTVLFERGGIYRGAFEVNSNTIYAAYGEGKKPALYGSAKNYADDNTWTVNADNDNVWQINLPAGTADIGSIIFNDGKLLGYKITADAEKTDSGYNIVTEANEIFFNQSREYSFWHDTHNNILYLYCSKGNPSNCFSSIEFAEGKTIMYGKENTTNVKIDNLTIKYGGAHGINFINGSNNIEITNCEIGFIGGSINPVTNEYVRFGNGIQFVNEYYETLVDNCWIYQCYDAGYTFQNCDKNVSRTERDMTVTNNLIEYCVYNIEIFGKTVTGNCQKDILIADNFLRMAGYGWGSVNRTGSSTAAVANICIFKPGNNSNGYVSDNFVIRDNILDNSYRYLISVHNPNGTVSDAITGSAITITGNTYVQMGFKPGVRQSHFGATYNANSAGTDLVSPYSNLYMSTSQSVMVESANAFDLNPTVYFEQ